MARPEERVAVRQEIVEDFRTALDQAARHNVAIHEAAIRDPKAKARHLYGKGVKKHGDRVCLPWLRRALDDMRDFRNKVNDRSGRLTARSIADEVGVTGRHLWRIAAPGGSTNKQASDKIVAALKSRGVNVNNG